MRQQHQHDADEADENRRPAIEPHYLLEQDGGEDDGEQRPRIADRRRIGQRQVGKPDEAAEHPRRAHEIAPHMPPEMARLVNRRDLVAISEPAHQRNQGEEGAKEHDLAGRIARADEFDARPHHREDEGRGDLENDAEERIHGVGMGNGDRGPCTGMNARPSRKPSESGRRLGFRLARGERAGAPSVGCRKAEPARVIARSQRMR